MKVVLDEAGATAAGAPPLVRPTTLARFLEEAQVTGQLDHPGIVPVHELGLDAEGRVYFTMKLVQGRDLQEIFGLVFGGPRDGPRRGPSP
jgi:serine/threonine-protein kinase